MRAYRGSPGGQEYNERNKAMGRARTAALRALARKYPAEFDRLYTEELKHAGLWPLQESGRRPQ